MMTLDRPLTVLALTVALGFVVNCGPDPSSSANPAAIQQHQHAEAASIARQRAEDAAIAAGRFDSSRDDIHKRLDGVANLAERESWTQALQTGDAMQRDLRPLFRSSIADTPEVVTIRTRLDALLARARQEENVIRRREDAYIRTTATNDLEVVNSEWTKTGFGSIAEWDVTIRNNSELATYSDIRYTTRYTAPSGTALGTHSGVIYETIRPGQARTFSDINDGFINTQASRAGFTITGATKSKR